MGPLEARVPVLLQAPPHDPVHRGRDRSIQGVERRGRLLQDRGQRRRHRVAPEGVLPPQKFVEDHPEGEEVGPRVHRLRPHLLGGHVSHRPHQHAGLGGARGRHLLGVHAHGGELGEAEVEDLDAPVRGEEEVLGLEVAVDDALAVCGGEALGGLDGPGEDLALCRASAG